MAANPNASPYIIPMPQSPDWQTYGVKVARAAEMDTNTPQTAGMTRAATFGRIAFANTDLLGTYAEDKALTYLCPRRS
jgi:hypothetical protein